MIFKWNCFLMLFCGNLFAQGLPPEPFPAEIVISTDKDSFMVYEEIPVTITYTNNYWQPVAITINQNCPGLVIYNSENELFDYKPFIYSHTPVDTVLLYEGERFHQSVEIPQEYRIPAVPDYYRIFFETSAFLYDMANDVILFDPEARIDLKSNTIVIDVVKPDGDEYEPHWRFELAMKHLKAKRYDRARDNFRSIVKNFPTSFFAELARKELIKFKE